MFELVTTALTLALSQRERGDYRRDAGATGDPNRDRMRVIRATIAAKPISGDKSARYCRDVPPGQQRLINPSPLF